MSNVVLDASAFLAFANGVLSPGTGPCRVDEVLTVSNDEVFEWARRLARVEGLMVGISSGANVAAAARLAARPEFQGKRIVTIMANLGERYLSTPLFEGLTQ